MNPVHPTDAAATIERVDFAEEFVRRFKWIDGHADVLGLLGDGVFLRATAEALATPFEQAGVTQVAGVEARGFILGTAVALNFGVGFLPIRKRGAVHPGATATIRAAPDWRGNETELLLQRRAVSGADLVLLVDDWIETGSQALAARNLVEECGGRWAGLSVLVDQAEPATREHLEPLASVVNFDALPSTLG